MDREGGRRPVRSGGVARRTVGRDGQSDVIWVGARFKMLLMTGKTIGRRVGKIAANMTFRTICNFVPLGKREKIVVYLVCSPARLQGIVAR